MADFTEFEVSFVQSGIGRLNVKQVKKLIVFLFLFFF